MAGPILGRNVSSVQGRCDEERRPRFVLDALLSRDGNSPEKANPAKAGDATSRT